MDTRRLEIERFDEALDRIRALFPRLQIEVDRQNGYVDAIADIPVQPGIGFAISINLQNQDELHINAGDHFWVEWFPCGTQEVFDRFTDALIGILTGNYRIVESYVFDTAVKAELQRPNNNGGWDRIATWANLRCLIPWPRTRRIVQNNVRAESP